MPESQYSITASISVGEMNASFITWNSGTGGGATALLVNNDISYNTLNITLAQTTTITGGVVTFQGSTDGVNWINLQGTQVGTGATIGPTYTLQASTYVVFSFNLTAIPYFQVLLSTAITGTGSLTIGYAADSFVSNAASASSSNNGSTVGNAPIIVAIGTTSTLVLAQNLSRKGLNLVNMSYETISLSFGSNAAVLYSGVNLGPGGTFWMDPADFTTAAVNAISTLTAAGGYLGVQEFQ
jgi:hypothetical protein